MSLNRNLLVSVVMSVHNGLPYLDDAVESILSQTHENLEFIIVDDGSTDGSSERLRDYARRDERIRLLAQDNTGLTKALVRGVSEATGAFIARMDADDVSLPKRLERQLEMMQQDPGLVAATCRFARHGALDGSAWEHPALGAPELIPWFLVFYNRIAGHGQVMFRKSAYDQAGGYDPSFRYAQDHDLWPRLLKFGRLGIVDEILYQYRVGHGDSISKRNSTEQQDCSFRVTSRCYAELTGEPLDAEWGARLRQFWTGRNEAEFAPADARRLDDLIGRAYHAYFGQNPSFADHRGELRSAIGRRWLFWSERADVRRPDVVAAYLLRALRWSPGLVFEGAAAQFRRIARAAKRGAVRGLSAA